MKVVMLGNVTELNIFSTPERRGIPVDLTFRIAGMVAILSSRGKERYVIVDSKERILKLSGGIEAPYIYDDMFVLYSEWFSETPTQNEIDNFSMVFGFTPSLEILH